ncbi:MAG: hypothetical protein BA874_08740 [Desulfuromonadales bacterium C00003068]|nr:MAG: hypothetical protein BA874_08740 [Desulfuromonadales bacterium C00003068]
MLQHMVQNIERTTQLVQEISAAKKEQDVCADLANKAIQQLDQLIQQNAQLSDQMATSAELSLITAGAIARINLVF